jgi:hypothetical protein
VSGRARAEVIDPEVRRAQLEQGAIAAGERWADRCRESLLQQGRRPSGGWPGTVREARALVAAHFKTELSGPAPTFEELELAAKISYARARRHWYALGSIEI